MKLSVVIVSWNTRELLRACLTSVYASGLIDPFEVIVFDNASSDGSSEMVRDEFPQAVLIASLENLGFAGGNNRAVQSSRGEYILLLNPDTVVCPGALQRLVEHLAQNPEVGANGARLLNADGSLQESCYPRPSLTRELWRLFYLDRFRPYGVYRMRDWELNKPRTVDVLMGACLLLRREVFEQVGLFDEQYFIYSEEVDLCTRVQQAGWKLAWVPEAQVVHLGGQSTQQVGRKMFLQLYRSKVLYFRKHYGRGAARAYKLILLAAAMGRLTLTPLAYLERPPKRTKHLALSGHYRSLLVSLPQM